MLPTPLLLLRLLGSLSGLRLLPLLLPLLLHKVLMRRCVLRQIPRLRLLAAREEVLVVERLGSRDALLGVQAQHSVDEVDGAVVRNGVARVGGQR